MEIDPDTIRRSVLALVFLVASVEVGLAALMRAVRESTPDGSND